MKATTRTPPGVLFNLADRALAGTLATRILTMDSEGLSVEGITKRLFRDYDIDVSRTLVSSWLRILKAEAS